MGFYAPRRSTTMGSILTTVLLLVLFVVFDLIAILLGVRLEDSIVQIGAFG